MATIQVVLDGDLLLHADRVAKRRRQNRSALIREALTSHLRRLDTKAREALDRAGYERAPHDTAESAEWAGISAWPED